MNTSSHLITGQVMHRRVRPIVHLFHAPVFYLRINLDTIEKSNSWIFGINKWRPLSLYFKDYGPRDGTSLANWIRKILRDNDIDSKGTIFLQTFPRVFGYVFNPISLWYCHHTDGRLASVLAEVRNTFGERHLYLLTDTEADAISPNSKVEARKMMHVSPFCEVKGNYQFHFFETDRSSLVKIDYLDGDAILINTCLSGKKLPFTPSNLFKTLLKQPLLTIGVIFKIHWQALLLWIKRVPFFRQPSYSNKEFSVSHKIAKDNQK